MERLKSFFKWLRSCITPGYITMLVAAFILWYITKLGETYTTERDIVVVMDGEEFEVTCTVRGKGTNLIGYRWGSKRKSIEIPSVELSFDSVVTDNEGRTYRHISAVSMQHALASRMSDVDIIAVGAIPALEVSESELGY